MSGDKEARVRRWTLAGAAILLIAASPQWGRAQVQVDGRAGIGAAFGGSSNTDLSGLFALGVGAGRFHVRLDVLANGGGYAEEWAANVALQVDVLRGPVRKPTLYLLAGLGAVSASSIFASDEYAVLVTGAGLQLPLTSAFGLFGELRGYFALNPPPEASSFGTVHAGIRVGAP